MLRAAPKARAAAAGLSLLCVLLAGPAARAGGPLAPQGAPIRTSGYAVDLFQGPVLASSRITALGGAYTAIADGAEGIPFNPAAVSLRAPYSTTNDDYDLTGSVTFSKLPVLGDATVLGTDFDNNGKVGFANADFLWASAGGYVQHGHAGFGANVSAQQYELGAPPGAADVKSLVLRLFKIDVVASYGFDHEQLHVGGGVRGAIFNAVDATSSEALLFGSNGVGVEGGALYTPRHLPLRLGATLRSPIIGATDQASRVTPDAAGDRRVGDFFLPEKVNLPWELEWGVAVQLGPRPLNLAWTDEDTLKGPEVERERRGREPAYKAARRILKRRYAAVPRRKLLLSFSALLTGPTGNAVGFESMIAKVVDRSGEHATLALRAGAEAEVIPNRLQLRAGTYMEPTRFRESSPRLHGTGGFEVRLFDWDVFGNVEPPASFRLSAAIDGAREYIGYSVGVGLWH